MNQFTPTAGAIGGSLIGLSSAILLLFNGDIMGASGIVSSVLLNPRKTIEDPALRWKLAFLMSFALAANFLLPVSSEVRSLVVTSASLSPVGYAIAGFFVGLGTKLSNGCTSGHGICGMARLSKRSFAAVATFMASGIVTASFLSPDFTPLAKHTTFLRSEQGDVRSPFASMVVLFVVVVAFWISPTKSESTWTIDLSATDKISKRKVAPAVVSGALFSVGLGISGMVSSAKVSNFLDLTGLVHGTYDPTLAFVMGAGFLVSFVSYQIVPGFNVFNDKKTLDCPVIGGDYSVPTNKTIDWKLVLGAALFGIGWGIGGFCPGPAMLHAAIGSELVIRRWWPCYLLGAAIAQKVKDRAAR